LAPEPCADRDTFVTRPLRAQRSGGGGPVRNVCAAVDEGDRADPIIEVIKNQQAEAIQFAWRLFEVVRQIAQRA